METIPANAHLPKLVWSSSNPKLAAVDQNGAVSLKKKAGGKKVVITAAATDGSGIRASCTIKVMKGSVKKITISGKRPGREVFETYCKGESFKRGKQKAGMEQQ